MWSQPRTALLVGVLTLCLCGCSAKHSVDLLLARVRPLCFSPLLWALTALDLDSYGHKVLPRLNCLCDVQPAVAYLNDLTRNGCVHAVTVLGDQGSTAQHLATTVCSMFSVRN